MWVKGHSGIQGNEEADRMASRTGWIERQLNRPEIATPARIKQADPIHSKPTHLGWDC